MWCPREGCRSGNNHVLSSRNQDSPRLPASLKGLNITRRYYQCDDCEKRFSTIEMLEEEFDDLKRPKRLEPRGLEK